VRSKLHTVAGMHVSYLLPWDPYSVRAVHNAVEDAGRADLLCRMPAAADGGALDDCRRRDCRLLEKAVTVLVGDRSTLSDTVKR